MGNGVAGAGGTADGKWDFLVGPDYTCPNYLSDEEISLVIDGVQQPLTMNMHRARNTGIFYGLATVGDLEVCLLDHASRGEPWTARLVIVKNKSATAAHKVSIQARVTPRTGSGEKRFHCQGFKRSRRRPQPETGYLPQLHGGEGLPKLVQPVCLDRLQ